MKTSRGLAVAEAVLTALAVLSGAVAAPLLCRPFYYAHIGPLGLEQLTGLTREQILRHLDPADYIGCCPEQVERFLRDCIQPVLEKYAGALAGHSAEITV